MNKNINQMIEYPKEGILSKSIAKSKSPCVFSLGLLDARSVPRTKVRGLLNTSTSNKLDVTLFCMAAGSEMSEHTSTKQGTIYVVEGKGIFNLEGEKIEMVPGAIIFMKENAKHSLTAKENTSFILTLT